MWCCRLSIAFSPFYCHRLLKYKIISVWWTADAATALRRSAIPLSISLSLWAWVFRLFDPFVFFKMRRRRRLEATVLLLFFFRGQLTHSYIQTLSTQFILRIHADGRTEILVEVHMALKAHSNKSIYSRIYIYIYSLFVRWNISGVGSPVTQRISTVERWMCAPPPHMCVGADLLGGGGGDPCT